MKRKLSFILMIITFFLTGCEINTTSSVIGDIPFEVVTTRSIENEAVLRWYERSRKEEGAFKFDDEEYTYILISAGERRTGGYSLNTMSITGDNKHLNVKAKLIEPLPSSMVVQVITYPSQLVRIEKDNREVVLKELIRERRQLGS
ncbi:protease complex subunit PrcB family protein [Serpentinicella sp. ANB-PHB4]|uniref:protease complex subunit PrcB family protein n=1 Tax=Serpentinicella sp. ANB-PHB4 TaxID=3074076 RepID=UPI002861FEB6|nr:protease complex subunit PrcB family protein [Serpentinicella sp. ANB-PHB4]MDR5659433.1 protease complex subunit PrcB family protein [Serpentinicella sp. ANB-PHB4]